MATLCLSFSIQTFGARTKNSPKNKKSGIPVSCLTCLNNFSPETLTFTTNPEKCPGILARCNKSNSTAKCEGIIANCFAQNCQTEGSCSDEIANRNLAYGCLKTESAYLPYTCASYISSLARNKADEIQSNLDAKERAHEIALKQQEAKIASEKAAAERAAADAEVKAAQAEAEAKARQAEIEAQTKLEQQKLQAQLEEQAKQAEIARQKQEKLDARNSKPNVKYNNILSAVKKDISTAKTHTSKAFNMLGIEKADNSKQTSAFGATPQIVTVYAISNPSADTKTKSYINASKYKTTTDFRCTKDAKESYVKSELLNALNVLTSSRDTLTDSIAELEASNADDETIGKISDDKINTLYEVQNKLTETINTIESEINELKTSCETRCAGVSSFSFTTSEIKFDENGLIVEDQSSGSDYSCKDFENSSTSNDIMGILAGGTSSPFGTNINQQIADLTKRVTKAVLTADRALVETEIAAATGNFGSSTANYAVINSCIKYTLDTEQYINCIKSTLGEQLQVLSQYPDENIPRGENYEYILREFNNSVYVALELLNSSTYISKAQCDESIRGNKDHPCCDEIITVSSTGSRLVNTTTTARQCSNDLANRLNKALKNKETNGATSSYIISINPSFITMQTPTGALNVTPTEFIANYCPKYPETKTEKATIECNATTTPTMYGPVNSQECYIKTTTGQIITTPTYANMCKEDKKR
ncbi:MAG: cell envelope integrity protein TolA [Alphaproteobacteria bacterium]